MSHELSGAWKRQDINNKIQGDNLISEIKNHKYFIYFLKI